MENNEKEIFNNDPMMNNANPGMVNNQPAMNNANPGIVNNQPAMNNANPGMVNNQPAMNNANPGMVNNQPVMNNVNPGMANNQPAMNNVNSGIVNNQPMMNNGNPGMVNNNNRPKTINKNIIFVIIGVVVVIVLIFVYFNFIKTKKLHCSMTESQSIMTMTSDVDMVYRGDSLQKMNMTMEVDLGEYSLYKDQFVEQFESQMGDKFDEINEKGGKASISSTDDTILIEISASRSGVSTMLSVDENYSFEEMKEQFEDMGYTCK